MHFESCITKDNGARTSGSASKEKYGSAKFCFQLRTYETFYIFDAFREMNNERLMARGPALKA